MPILKKGCWAARETVQAVKQQVQRLRGEVACLLEVELQEFCDWRERPRQKCGV